MKKVFALIAVLLTASILSAQTQKIGYVDTQTILTQYSAAIKATSDLEAIAAKWRTSVDSMAQDLQGKYADYQQKASTMTPDAQKATQQQLVQQEQYIQKFNQQKFGQGGELAAKQEELLRPVRQKIYDAIEEVSKKEKIKFVFDKAGDVLLLYADPTYDLTFKVLDKLKTK